MEKNSHQLVSSENLMKYIQMQNDDSTEKLTILTSRGLEPNDFQLRRLFLRDEDRQTGKTWTAYMKIFMELMYKYSKYTYTASNPCSITITALDGDTDKLDKHQWKTEWLRDLVKFGEKYFPECTYVKHQSRDSYSLSIVVGVHERDVEYIDTYQFCYFDSNAVFEQAVSEHMSEYEFAVFAKRNQIKSYTRLDRTKKSEIKAKPIPPSQMRVSMSEFGKSWGDI